MQLEPLDVISLLYVFLSILFALFLLTKKVKNRTSNTLIALFLIVNAQDGGSQFVSMFVYPNLPGLGMAISSSIFLKLPLLYLYVLSVIYADFKLKKEYLWHLAPLILITLVLIPRYYGVSYEQKIAYLQYGNQFNRLFEIKLSYILVHLQLIAYIIASFMAVNRYKLLLLENYSNTSLFNYKWLFQLLALFTLDAVIASVKNGFMFLQLESAYDYTQTATSIITLVFIIWIVLKALQSPEIFKGVDSRLQLVKNFKSPVTSINSPIEQFYKSPETNHKIEQLKTFMKNEAPYLDPAISIYSLAKLLGMQSQELSVLINRDLNTHFFDFINGYRIEKAMELLANPAKKEFTILEILYEVGFNSKSSFNTAFKKHAHTTPTEFRKTSLKSAS